jgi:hypothetical protein
MTPFTYKDIDFQDITQVSANVQYWLYKIERLNRHGQMSIEFAKESVADWRNAGLGSVREQILEETIEVLNLALHLDLQKTKNNHVFQKRTFYVPIEQLMAEGATDIFKTYPSWQTHLSELDKTIHKLENMTVYDKNRALQTQKLIGLLAGFDVFCSVVQARQAA